VGGLICGTSNAMTLNGITRDDLAGLTIRALLELESLPQRGIAVAVNGTIVPRSTWEQVLVSGSDRIEVVTAAAGG